MSDETTLPKPRIFEYSGVRLEDPNPALTPDEVRKSYIAQYADLATATISAPVERAGKSVYTFLKTMPVKA